jgi:hypothetical protein
MMLDSPHTLASMLMRGNALVLKTPVENAPRTSIEKHLSWSPDIPPAARFPLHRSRPAEYQPNRQPATVCAEELGGKDTTSSRTTTRAANELSPPKSACAGDAVLRTSTRGTVHVGQFLQHCAQCVQHQHANLHRPPRRGASWRQWR